MKIMCTHRLLQQCPDGYVLHCLRCNQMQIAFGTCIVSCDRSQFYVFLESLEDAYAPFVNSERRQHKQIRIPTINKGLTPIFSLDELDRLLCILRNARMEVEYCELFQFNQN